SAKKLGAPEGRLILSPLRGVDENLTYFPGVRKASPLATLVRRFAAAIGQLACKYRLICNRPFHCSLGDDDASGDSIDFGAKVLDVLGDQASCEGDAAETLAGNVIIELDALALDLGFVPKIVDFGICLDAPRILRAKDLALLVRDELLDLLGELTRG